VLAFTNQEIATSIAFFKRLLVRRGVFAHETMRHPGFTWDDYNTRIADELIDLYRRLEAEVT
jgi:4-hydroxy-tetrahydrodipicolinate synthase